MAVVQDQFPYGNMVIVETGSRSLPSEIKVQFGIAENESLYILYAHFRNPPLVALGDQVECGQALGEVGATGYNIVNPHLHLETRIGPPGIMLSEGMMYYDTRATEAERANYELWRTSGVFRHFDPMALIENYLEKQGYDAKAVRDIDPRMRDEDIIRVADSENRMVITMDKDFGELVYHSSMEHSGVLLLRLDDARGEEKLRIFKTILENYSDRIKNCFCVFQNNKFRVRNIIGKEPSATDKNR